VRRPPQVIVMGGGPVGMVAALQASRHGRTTLIVRRPRLVTDTPRVEAVPAPFLALMVDFGIHPRQLGVEHLHEVRSIAWDQEAPVSSPRLEAHVERPALDVALLNRVIAANRVRLIIDDHHAERAAAKAGGTPGLRVIDASGRAAVTAVKRVQPRRPWAARCFWTPVHEGATDTSLRIAALPGGFVYRLGTCRALMLGIVGRHETIGGPIDALPRRIHDARADWVLDGLSSIAALKPGRVSPASVQWTVAGSALAVGDASLARDTLSSQGLATGVSEALCAAEGEGAEDDALFAVRQIEQRFSHLRALEQLASTCRFAQSDAWMDYLTFLREHIPQARSTLRMALWREQLIATCEASRGHEP
jgi:2-polyprenyl-6-methoxyphenol hydroxylase-like FAD-dependent oxidoreductase